MLGLKQGWI